MKLEIEKLLTDPNEIVRTLATEVKRLRSAITEHRDKSGHELCWLNDVELWRAVSDDPKYPHQTLPVREEFLAQCSRYHESRLKGTPYAEPNPRKTVK